MDKTVHVPVMMQEALTHLNLKKRMVVVDATLGGGGYTRALHDAVMPGGRVIAIDADQDAIARFRDTYPEIAQEITLVHSNYVHVREVLKDLDVKHVDALVADLGLSSDQLDRAEKGFSFQSDGPLDMRLDATRGITAHKIVNEYDLDEITRIIREYGEEKHARRIAKAIVAARPLATTRDVAQVIEGDVGGFYRKEKIHPATRTFQALRIATNDEYQNLEAFLTAGIDVLVRDGRMSVVSFHSGEDRIVKNVFRTNARGCICPPEVPLCVCNHVPRVQLITRKPLAPSQEEVANNPRSRSARLRCVEKIRD